jgi:hypothetical protein
MGIRGFVKQKLYFTPDVQQVLLIGAGTESFSQQRAFGPCTPGLTYVHALHRGSAMQAVLQSDGDGTSNTNERRSPPRRSMPGSIGTVAHPYTNNTIKNNKNILCIYDPPCISKYLLSYYCTLFATKAQKLPLVPSQAPILTYFFHKAINLLLSERSIG